MSATKKRNHDQADIIPNKYPRFATNDVYKANVTMQSADGPTTQFDSAGNGMSCSDAFTLGDKLSEDNCKIVYNVTSKIEGRILIALKDQFHDNAAGIFASTHCCVMEMLQDSGIQSSFIKWVSEKSFLSWKCSIIPIEVISYRFDTESSLKAASTNSKTMSFHPLRLKMLLKKDGSTTNTCFEDLKYKSLCVDSVPVSGSVLEAMEQVSTTAFEVIEKYWKSKDVDIMSLKLEFGFHPSTKNVVITSLVYNTTWELKHSKKSNTLPVYSYMKAKQTDLKNNHQWVKDSLEQAVKASKTSNARVLLISAKKCNKTEEIRQSVESYGLTFKTYTLPSFKCISNLSRLISEVENENDSIPTLLVSVRDDTGIDIGAVLGDMTCMPIITLSSAPASDGSVPYCGLHAYSVEHLASMAGHILGQHNTRVWCKLRARKLQKALMNLQSDEKNEEQ